MIRDAVHYLPHAVSPSPATAVPDRNRHVRPRDSHTCVAATADHRVHTALVKGLVQVKSSNRAHVSHKRASICKAIGGAHLPKHGEGVVRPIPLGKPIGPETIGTGCGWRVDAHGCR